MPRRRLSKQSHVRDVALYEVQNQKDTNQSIQNKMQKLAKPMNWEDRRRLANDIGKLSSCDIAGVLLRIYNHPKSLIVQCLHEGDIFMDALVDLDKLDDSLLWELRHYVELCYQSSFFHPEVCGICEGMWSSQDVVSCATEGCDTKVHEDCFGPLIRSDPNGPWYCPSCSEGRLLSCMICLQPGKALKRTSDGKWAHLLCALVIPETRLGDNPTFEPIEGTNKIDNSRYRLTCNICRKRAGACVVCADEDCSLGFHPQCAADAGFLIGTSENPFALFCDKHIPENHDSNIRRWVSEDDLLFKESFIGVEDQNTNYDFILPSSAFLKLCHEENSVTRKRKIYKNTTVRIKDATLDEYRQKRFHIDPDILASKKANSKLHDKSNEKQVKHLNPSEGSDNYKNNSRAVETNGVPEFPYGKDLLNSIVDVYWKSADDWFTAKVVDWSSRNRNHLLKYFIDGFEEWTRARAYNTHVLHLPSDYKPGDGIRIKLVRVLRKGKVTWRIKPKDFVDPPHITAKSFPLTFV